MTKDENIFREPCTEYLKCILSDMEKRDLAEKMALAIAKITELEGQLKSVQSQIRADIARYDGELSLASEQYRSGFEMRKVDCVLVKDYMLGTVMVTRLDTQEIVRERSMTTNEHQREFSFEEDNNGRQSVQD